MGNVGERKRFALLKLIEYSGKKGNRATERKV
jgi:hypothetical protein